MKLVTFTHDGSTRIGVVVEDGVVDLRVAAPELPTEMVAFLEAGPSAMAAAHAALADADRMSLAEVRLEAPIARPPKFLAVGLNYADHVAEANLETPETPMIFNKQSTYVVGPYDEVHLPRASKVLDYEGELIEQAMGYVRPAGKLLVVGYDLSGPFSVWAAIMVMKELQIVGCRATTRKNLAELVELVEQRKVLPVVDDVLPLAKIQEAYHRLDSGQVMGRIVVEP